MATLFVSYRWADREAASALVAASRRHGHELRYDSEMVIGLPWREKLLSALLGSDGMVLLWTERTASSQHVAAEVGAVRATAAALPEGNSVLSSLKARELNAVALALNTRPRKTLNDQSSAGSYRQPH